MICRRETTSEASLFAWLLFCQLPDHSVDQYLGEDFVDRWEKRNRSVVLQIFVGAFLRGGDNSRLLPVNWYIFALQGFVEQLGQYCPQFVSIGL